MSDDPASYRTPAELFEHEIDKIKGSRFLALVAQAGSEEEAMAHIAAVRKQHHAARHHCWAWRIGQQGETSRSSDDGEPSGSAGRPILQAIEGADITFVVAVVTRYFGGTKLGVGGLVRAYGGAAAEALSRAPVTVVVPTRAVRVELDYDQLGIIEGFCSKERIAKPQGEYGARVRLQFDIPSARAEAFAARLHDFSSGRLQPEIEEG